MPIWFNGGTQPLVLPDVHGWGGGVVMPGEKVETDLELGPPFVRDEEAEAALERKSRKKDAAADAAEKDTPADPAATAEKE